MTSYHPTASRNAPKAPIKFNALAPVSVLGAATFVPLNCTVRILHCAPYCRTLVCMHYLFTL